MRTAPLLIILALLAAEAGASDWTTGVEATRNRRAQEAAAIQRDVDQLTAQTQTNQLLQQLLAQQARLSEQSTRLTEQLQLQNRLLAEMLRGQRDAAAQDALQPPLR